MSDEMKNFQKVMDPDSMTKEQLAEAQALADKVIRAKAADIVARIDAGESVKAFVVGIEFIGDDSGPSVHAGGHAGDELKLLDILTFLIARAAVDSGSLIPQLAERMLAVNAGDAIPVSMMMKIAMDTARLFKSMAGANQQAADAAEALIRRAGGGPVGGTLH